MSFLTISILQAVHLLPFRIFFCFKKYCVQEFLVTKKEDLRGLGLRQLGRAGNPKSLLSTACGNVNSSDFLESNSETCDY